MDKSLNVRYMTEDDIPMVERLFDETDAPLHANFTPDMIDDTDYYIGAFIEEAGEERLIGFCTVGLSDDWSRDDVDDCILSDVYVDERERNKGYGSTIVEKAIDLAAEQYDKEALIYIDILDSDLSKWYSKFGFAPAETDGDTILSMKRLLNPDVIKEKAEKQRQNKNNYEKE